MWELQTRRCQLPQGMRKDKRARPGLPWKHAGESSDDDSTWDTRTNVAETRIMQVLPVSCTVTFPLFLKDTLILSLTDNQVAQIYSLHATFCC